MISSNDWISVTRLEALITHCLNCLINIWLANLNTLEFFILKVHLVNLINNVSWLILIISNSSEVLFCEISLILSLVSVNPLADGRFPNTWVSGEVAVNRIGGRLTVRLSIQVL